MKNFIIAMIVIIGLSANVHAIETSITCKPTNTLLPQISPDHKNLINLALSNRYCFDIEPNIIKVTTDSLTTTRKEARKVVSDFREVYSTLKTDKQKIEFTDDFLINVSNRYYVVIYELNGSLVVTIRARGIGSKVTGYGITLFSELVDGKVISNPSLTESFFKYLEQKS